MIDAVDLILRDTKASNLTCYSYLLEPAAPADVGDVKKRHHSY